MVTPKECLFCRIVKGEIPAKKVYEDPGALAFLDINPRNPGHTLVIPKTHYETIFEIPEAEAGRLFTSVRKVAVLVKNGMNTHGLSLCQNNGSAAGQVVAHLHFHLIPRYLNEGPSALESFLPVKKMDDKSLDKVVAAIKAGAAPRAKATKEKEEEREEREERPAREEKPKAKPAPARDGEEDEDEFEELNF